LTAGQSKRLSDLRDRAKELQSELGKFAGKQYLTPKQEEELKQLREEERLIQEEIRKTADEHEKATKRILFDILQQQAAMGGLTEQEVDMLAQIAEGWELIDPATATAMKAAALFFQKTQDGAQLTQEELDQLEAAMLGVGTAAQTSVPKASSTFNGLQTSANNARAAVERVQGAIDNLKSKTITIKTVFKKTTVTDSGGTTGGGGVWDQAGGDFIVPQGYPNDSFLHFVSSGERVITLTKPQQQKAANEMIVPSQSKSIVPNNGLPTSGGDIYANITIIAQPTQNEEAIARRVLYRMRDVMRYQLAGGGIQGI